MKALLFIIIVGSIIAIFCEALAWFTWKEWLTLIAVVYIIIMGMVQPQNPRE